MQVSAAFQHHNMLMSMRLSFTGACALPQVTARGAGMVVAVVQDPGAGDLPQDRVTAVCHNLALEPRWVVLWQGWHLASAKCCWSRTAGAVGGPRNSWQQPHEFSCQRL